MSQEICNILCLVVCILLDNNIGNISETFLFRQFIYSVYPEKGWKGEKEGQEMKKKVSRYFVEKRYAKIGHTVIIC